MVRGYEQVPWTDEERQQLRRLHDNGMSQGQIAQAMGRSKNSIHRQLANLGLVRSERNSVVVKPAPGHAAHRSPRTTLPPLPSLSMGADGECKADKPWDGTGWPRNEDFWP